MVEGVTGRKNTDQFQREGDVGNGSGYFRLQQVFVSTLCLKIKYVSILNERLLTFSLIIFKNCIFY